MTQELRMLLKVSIHAIKSHKSDLWNATFTGDGTKRSGATPFEAIRNYLDWVEERLQSNDTDEAIASDLGIGVEWIDLLKEVLKKESDHTQPPPITDSPLEQRIIMQTQEKLDNGILEVDLDLYQKSEEYRIECAKIFSPPPPSEKLTVWLVESIDGVPVSYDSLTYIQTVIDRLSEGMVIATKAEYEKAEQYLLATLDNHQPTAMELSNWDTALGIAFGSKPETTEA